MEGPRAGLDIVEKRKISCSYRESEPILLGCSVCSLVAIPTELSRLPLYLYDDYYHEKTCSAKARFTSICYIRPVKMHLIV
jgi:hypothetical protein